MDRTVEQANEALRLAEADPRRALDVAAGAARAAAQDGDIGTASVSARATGLALFYLHDVDGSLRALRDAVSLGRRARSSALAAQAQMTLAYVLNWRGRPRAALHTIDTAVRDLDGVDRARAQAQRATIRHQLGRFEEAVADYDTALVVLREAGDEHWAARVLANRALGHGHNGDFEAAMADLHEAERIYERLGLALSVGHVYLNLGDLNALRGDIPVALSYFDRAEARYRELGSQLAPLLCDRAEVLMAARLLPEAREAAEQAVQACLSEGRRAILPEARLLLARVEQLRGNLPDALLHARVAVRELNRLGQAKTAALARLLVLTLRLEGDGPAPSSARLEHIAAATGGRWPQVPMEARIFAAQSAMRRGKQGHALELLSAASYGRNGGSATFRARAWYATALLKRLQGNDRGALSAARTGLRILDEYAAVLGATDVRAHVATHREDLAVLGLRIAIERKSTHQTFAWAELGRASHLQRAPARPPEDEKLASALAELRVVMQDIDERGAAGRSSGSLTARQAQLERQIRDRHRRQRAEAGEAVGAVSVPELAEALGEASVVEYVALDDTLYAVTVADGRARLGLLCSLSEVIGLAERLPFAVHRLARRRSTVASREAAQKLLRATADRLDALMLRPLRELGERPLVIIPTGRLQWLPWSVLPSCVGRPVTVSPSASLWYAAQRRPRASGAPLVAAGPSLPGAHDEATAVAAIHDAKPLLGEDANIETVLAGLGGASLVHLATHGLVRADNPQFSSLRLADGPLMIYDLEKLQKPPHTVVVAACDTGRPVSPAGDELLGLTATLLAQGSTQLVASVLPILDLETRPLMSLLHGGMAAGQPPAVALASAQQAIASTGPTEIATAAGFLCFGAGFTAPFTGGTESTGKDDGDTRPRRGR